MKILVICTGNSCRSQMAEGWFNSFSGVLAKSAGTHPEPVNPYAIAVMREAGIDISANRSNHVDEFVDERFDYVITVCDHALQNCPVFPGSAGKKMHHSFEDPAKFRGYEEQTLNKYREVRDKIKLFTERFLKDNS